MGRKYREWSEWWVEQDTKHLRTSPSLVTGVAAEVLCTEWKSVFQKAGKSMTMAPASCAIHRAATQPDRRETQKTARKRKTSSLFWLWTHSINGFLIYSQKRSFQEQTCHEGLTFSFSFFSLRSPLSDLLQF